VDTAHTAGATTALTGAFAHTHHAHTFAAVIRIGRIQELLVLRVTPEGVILGDEDDVEVLLPRDMAPEQPVLDEPIMVFVYRDGTGRYRGSTRFPKAQAGEFANFQVDYVDHRGAHLEWELDVDLLVPHKEQPRELLEHKWYVVRLEVDPASGRIFGSARIENYLDNAELTVKAGDAVDLLLFSRSDIGLSVIVNNRHRGLVHANEVFKEVSLGDRVRGHVKQVREDNKLDITLQPIGFRQSNEEHVALLVKRLRSSKMLPLTDDSPAEEIYRELGMSKKAFKKALGSLYKQRKVRIGSDRIEWMG
jgi:uncharacterized protein